jgi:hypothetical protein
MQTSTYAESPPPPRARTWFALLAPPAAWALQLAAGAVLTGIACERGAIPAHLGNAGLRTLELAISGALLATTVACLVIGLRAFRSSGEESILAVQGRTRPEYLATLALFVSAIFTLAIIHAALPQAMLPLCETMR